MNIPVVIKINEQTWSAAVVDDDVEFQATQFDTVYPHCDMCECAIEEGWIVEEPGHEKGYMCGACATYVMAGQPGTAPEDHWRHVG